MENSPATTYNLFFHITIQVVHSYVRPLKRKDLTPHCQHTHTHSFLESLWMRPFQSLPGVTVQLCVSSSAMFIQLHGCRIYNHKWKSTKHYSQGGTPMLALFWFDSNRINKAIIIVNEHMLKCSVCVMRAVPLIPSFLPPAVHHLHPLYL